MATSSHAFTSAFGSLWSDLQTALSGSTRGPDAGDSASRYEPLEAAPTDPGCDAPAWSACPSVHQSASASALWDPPNGDASNDLLNFDLLNIPQHTSGASCGGGPRTGAGTGDGGQAPPVAESSDALTSAAVSLGSVLLGSALGAAAAITVSPFVAAGLGAGLLLAGFFATTAVDNAIGPEGAGGDTGEVEVPPTVLLEEEVAETEEEEEEEEEVEEEEEEGRANGGCTALGMGSWSMMASTSASDWDAAASAPLLPRLPAIRVKSQRTRNTRLDEMAADSAWYDWVMP